MLKLLRTAVHDHQQTVVMVTHDPIAAAYADSVTFLADGQIVGSLNSPTAATVSDQMLRLEGARAIPAQEGMQP